MSRRAGQEGEKEDKEGKGKDRKAFSPKFGFTELMNSEPGNEYGERDLDVKSSVWFSREKKMIVTSLAACEKVSILTRNWFK